MKKLFEKIISIALAIISTLFVALVIAVLAGSVETADFQNALVKGIIISLTVIFGLLTGLNLYAAFTDRNKMNSVLIFKDRGSATKVTVDVIKATARRISKQVKETKVRKVHLFTDDNGNVGMNIEVKLSTDETMEAVTRLRAMLIEQFKDVFGIEFSTIDFKVVKSKNAHLPSNKAVEEKVALLKESIIFNTPAPEATEAPEAKEAEEAAAVETEDVIATDEVVATEDAVTSEEEVVEAEEAVTSEEEAVATEEVVAAEEEVTSEEVIAEETLTEEN